jgi:hypothetical protein
MVVRGLAVLGAKHFATPAFYQRIKDGLVKAWCAVMGSLVVKPVKLD